MYSLYKLEKLADGSGYQFVTSTGDIYTTYFTDFTLTNAFGEDVPVISFGFNCERADESINTRHDGRVKYTIIHIIEAFFNEQPENAVLYICLAKDGKARNRQITFNSWFSEFSEDIEKYDVPKALQQLNFYCSLLIWKNNRHKQQLIDAFYYTINYWGLDS